MKTEGVCDKCGGTRFERRPDDNADVIHARMSAYRALTKPILPYYRERDLLVTVDGMAKVDDVTRQIAKAVERVVKCKEELTNAKECV
ncbi:MAG: hypothetical protein U9N14_02540, partial [Pseudomonadota bacterium]|nr:hypothetical protein [Pseudomonadota bacterium]